MTRAIDTLTDDEVAIYIEARRHKPRPATTRDIHSQRMAWAVEEIRAEERERCARIVETWYIQYLMDWTLVDNIAGAIREGGDE